MMRRGIIGLVLVGGVVAALAAAVWWLGGDDAELPAAVEPADPAVPTALQQVLAEIEADGSWSEETALRAFAATFGPLPGVTVPEGPEPASQFAGVALHLMGRHFEGLSPEMREAVVEAAGDLAPALTGLEDDGEARRGARQVPIALSQDEYEVEIQALAGVIASRVGRSLTLPIEVVVADEQWKNFHATASPLFTGDGPIEGCRITIYPLTQTESGANLTAILAHETWHCFQYAQLKTIERRNAAPPWIVEGQAMWVGETISGGSNVPDKTVRYWTDYLHHPERGLFARSYDAIGFYSHLDDAGIDPWSVLDPMLDATPSNLAALEAALGTPASGVEVITTWGPSWFRDATPTLTFALIKAPGIPGVDVRPAAMQLTVGEGESREVTTASLTAQLAEVSVEAEILTVEVDGQAVIGDLILPRDIVIRDQFQPDLGIFTPSEPAEFCVIEECVCPDGRGAGPTERIGHLLRVAVTGDWTGGTTARLSGSSLEERCDDPEPETPTPGGGPCANGCGTSNGDPHLTTVDGASYDFQAAGEFTLLRSADEAADGGTADDAVEDRAFVLQTRQVPYEDSDAVAINAAIAVGASGDRVVFHGSPSGVRVVVNGEETALEGEIELGSLRVRRGSEAFEVRHADGSTVWVIDLGEWGLNVVVAPSVELASTGVGLLGAAGAEEELRLPDGSSLDLGIGYYEAIYGVLAKAWAISAEESLFDYAPGEGPETFRDASFPSPSAPVSFEDLDELLREIGLAACFDIGDDELQRECAFDVAVTGDEGFVAGYEVTESLIAPPPPPTGSPVGGELVPVIEDVTVINGSAVAPDGRLYLSVLLADDSYELVAVDPRAQEVLARVPIADGGLVAFADDSVWVTGAGDDCAIRRFDPRTLEEQASVSIACYFSFLQAPLTGATGTVWYYDSSGAGGEDGVRLRAVDPATNEPAEGVAVPFNSGYFRGNAEALFYSDVFEGTFRWRPGEAEFTEVPVAGLFAYPSRDGYWDQAGDDLRYTDGTGAARTTFSSGRLVGATDEAGLVQRDGAEGPELWAYPNDGSPQYRVAEGPTVGSGAAEQQLDYIGDEPAFVLGAEGAVVRHWLVRSSAEPDRGVVYVQWIDLSE